MKKNLHPIMLAGTGSDVGKSVIAAALCRIFKQDGYRPAPFKAQNMAFIDYLLEPYAEKLECHTVLDYRTYKEEQYDKLAEHVRSHLNLPLLYQIMSGND